MKNKTFDCVEMKNEIQRTLQGEYKGLVLEERRARMNERILSDPVLGPAYRRSLDRKVREQMKVAEESPEYKTRKEA
ncbi:hypothetical protein [Pontiella sulfatireligans]|uniref:Uncharacterized protein n=1 Tax=Pontiella sulfatireligans TaxID=2750658 RepID=A0A6C2UQB6_9BACT|nr:hypothetical protein [Pontiella sulfatireligans]VGO21196.1 hypothetical protein SCARR_03267 [Pontiella sulfatireligans]